MGKGRGHIAATSASFTIEGRRRRSTLSMAPLIDVTFILLIFFMVATQFSRFVPVDVRVHKAPVKTLQPHVVLTPGRKLLKLHVRADGTFELDGREIGDLENFIAVLLRHPSAAGDNTGDKPLLQVDPDGEVSVQLLIDTMNALKGLSGFSVQIITKKPDSNTSDVAPSMKPPSGRVAP